MEKKLQEILYQRGVYWSRIGYIYFIRAVARAVEQPERTQHMTTEIYVPIAQEFNQRPNTIQKAIGSVRDTLMKNGGEELLSGMVGGHKWGGAIPYPKEVIDIFAYYIRQQKDTDQKQGKGESGGEFPSGSPFSGKRIHICQ